MKEFEKITAAYLAEISERAGKARAQRCIERTLRELQAIAETGTRSMHVEDNHPDVQDFFEKRGFKVEHLSSFGMEVSW